MHLKITSESMSGKSAVVECDGVVLTDVTECTVHFAADDFTRATLTRTVERLEIDTDGVVTVALLPMAVGLPDSVKLLEELTGVASAPTVAAGAERSSSADRGQEGSEEPQSVTSYLFGETTTPEPVTLAQIQDLLNTAWRGDYRPPACPIPEHLRTLVTVPEAPPGMVAVGPPWFDGQTIVQHFASPALVDGPISFTRDMAVRRPCWPPNVQPGGCNPCSTSPETEPMDAP